MTTFALPASAVEAKAPDPTKHVNYTLGMILGVDDFNQEFAWLSGRDRWLARDAIGYGTLCGLLVSTDTVAKGPRLLVSSGSALTPRGQLVCVKPAQCASLNDWLAANKAALPALVGSPPASALSLYLTLCYRDCPVDPVPIPGEPCRSEDELLQPSRRVDDFSLELRTEPPNQQEEDAIVEFVRWLRALTVGGGGPYASVAAFAQTLRSAVQAAGSVSSPPASPLSSPLSSPPCASGGIHFNFGSPLLSLHLDPAFAADYWRAALRVWIEEIRPRVHALCTAGCGCSGCSGQATDPCPPDDCLLLARIDVPVVNVGSGEWRVDDKRAVLIDDSKRPLLAHLRLLQEWAFGEQVAFPFSPLASPLAPIAPAVPIVPVVPHGPVATIVAAGIVGHGFVQPPVLDKLSATFDSTSRLKLTFSGYRMPDATRQYVIKAMALSGALRSKILNPTIVSDGFDSRGFFLKITNGAQPIADATLKGMHFMVEVTCVQ
jgi:hypothetical protein